MMMGVVVSLALALPFFASQAEATIRGGTTKAFDLQNGRYPENAGICGGKKKTRNEDLCRKSLAGNLQCRNLTAWYANKLTTHHHHNTHSIFHLPTPPPFIPV